MIVRRLLLLAALTAALVAPVDAQVRLDRPHTLGRYLSGYMTAVGITNDSLARLVPSLAKTQSARVTRLSAIRNGTQATADSVFVRIGKALDSLMRARLDTTAELKALELIRQVRARPVVVPPTPVVTVTVTDANNVMGIGFTAQLTATLRDAAGAILTGPAVTWTSSNPAVATVSATGLVTGRAAGSVTITASSGGRSGTAAVAVQPPR